MKLSTAKYKKNYRAFILDHIDQDYNGNELKTDKAKIRFLFDRFQSEYGWHIDQVGKRNAMINWLSGLALPLPCYNGEIIDLAIAMGSIDENPTDKTIDRVLDNYWSFMAGIILQMEKESANNG